jgi:hypothetical protein
MHSLTAKSNLPELEPGGTAQERFEESMILHGKKPSDLPIILRNTFYSTIMYGILSVAYIAIVLFSLWSYPPHDIVAVLIRLGAFPIIAALLFKHAFTNWIVRERRLGTATEFLLSGKFMPSM